MDDSSKEDTLPPGDLQSLVDSSKEGLPLRRPMNAFLIFCKKHRAMVRERNPHLDNRSVTRILGELWANLPNAEKNSYLNVAKQYRDAFMKANPDFHWHGNNKRDNQAAFKPVNRPGITMATTSGNSKSIVPGKLADPSNMGGLGLLLMAGATSAGMKPGDIGGLMSPPATSASKNVNGEKSHPGPGDNDALLQLAEMCSSQLESSSINNNIKPGDQTAHQIPLPGSYAMTPPWTPQYEGQSSPSHDPGAFSPSEHSKEWPLDLSSRSAAPKETTANQNQNKEETQVGELLSNQKPQESFDPSNQKQAFEMAVRLKHEKAHALINQFGSYNTYALQQNQGTIPYPVESRGVVVPQLAESKGALKQPVNITSSALTRPLEGNPQQQKATFKEVPGGQKPMENHRQVVVGNQQPQHQLFQVPSSTIKVSENIGKMPIPPNMLNMEGVIDRANMPSGRMIVDKMIETVFSKEMLQRDNRKSGGGSMESEELRKRPSSVTEGRIAGLLNRDRFTKTGPLTFSEIQESLIRKAMEDSNTFISSPATTAAAGGNPGGKPAPQQGAVYSAVSTTAATHTSARQPTVYTAVSTTAAAQTSASSTAQTSANTTTQQYKDISKYGHLGMDLAVRNFNPVVTSKAGNSKNNRMAVTGAQQQFVPVVLPGNSSQPAVNTPSHTYMQKQPESNKTAFVNIAGGLLPQNKVESSNHGYTEVDLMCKEDLSSLIKNETSPESKAKPPETLSDAVDLICREELSGYDSEETPIKQDKFHRAVKGNVVPLRLGGSSVKLKESIESQLSTHLMASAGVLPLQDSEIVKTEAEKTEIKDLQKKPVLLSNNSEAAVETQPAKTRRKRKGFRGNLNGKNLKDDVESSYAGKVDIVKKEPGVEKALPLKKRGRNQGTVAKDIVTKVAISNAEIKEKKPRRRRRNVMEMTIDPYGEKKDGNQGEGEVVVKGDDSVNVDNIEDDDVTGVRKSKRRNRGQKYQELLSQGLLQAGRHKRTESTSENGEVTESMATVAKRHRKSTTSDTDTMATSFDLEAEIASLPACHIEESPPLPQGGGGSVRPGLGRGRHRVKGSLENKQTESQQDNAKLKELNIAELRQLTKVTTGGSSGSVTGSQKRKARKMSITHLVAVKKCESATEDAIQLSNSSNHGEDPTAANTSSQQISPLPVSLPSTVATAPTSQITTATSTTAKVVSTATAVNFSTLVDVACAENEKIRNLSEVMVSCT